MGLSSVPCPVCGFDSLPVGIDALYCCGRRACSHAFQHPPEVSVRYGLDYVKDRYDRYATTSAMSHLRLGFLSAFVPGGRVLDVGYGNGDFVKTAIRAGFDAYGNDVHGCGAAYGVREVFLGGGEEWDAITFFDSLEHFSDLSAVRSAAAGAAVVVVSFPFRPVGFPSCLVDRPWKHYRPGEHLHYFSLESLSLLFDSHEPVAVSSMEDAIRGRGDGGSRNIVTVAFRRGLRESGLEDSLFGG